jgi:hypothetical protein
VTSRREIAEDKMAAWSELVQTQYPPPSVFDFNPIEKRDLNRFVRIIMTEGIPFACQRFPMQFEFARGRAAEALGIHPKQISLTGSARIGYSLSPNQFGKTFEPLTSDIDLFVVDSKLFDGLVDDFDNFIEAWKSDSIGPQNKKQEQYWNSSRDKDPHNIENGFLDAYHIPAEKRFPTSYRISYAAIVFEKNLEQQMGRKVGSKAKIRVYRDWHGAIDRITFNIKSALKYRTNAALPQV